MWAASFRHGWECGQPFCMTLFLGEKIELGNDGATTGGTLHSLGGVEGKGQH